jgi:rRNA biogenesis protein RRP5
MTMPQVKAGHLDAARAILDRLCTLSLSTQKVKKAFKKYLQLEMEFGDETTVQAVKEKAREYVQSHV